ncbi:MAG TPA: peptidylprolyl isomerase [Thermoanaerobaculia bacterium]|nr:peptidylprolyl isomerase [Thermoanaerobaculia bacterium]
MNRLPLLVLTLIFAATAAASDYPVRKYEFLSDLYTIEKKYRSMEGPASMKKVTLLEGPPELLWITGVKTEMVEEDGTTPQLPELMCHVNVDLEAERHRALFNFRRNVATRLVTLSQGITDTRVPEGFGFPILSNEPLLVYTQVLNHNITEPQNLKVRHRVTFEFIRDSELQRPIKALMNLGASGMVILDDNPLAVVPKIDLTAGSSGETASSGEHGASCLMLRRAPNATGMGSDYVDPKGRKMTGHWIVPPGRQVNHSDVSWFMGLPYDTKLHYAAVHLHPFAESLTLRDVTADKTIFTAKAKNPENRVGLDHVDTFLSREGVMLYKDHEYELISVYNNPTEETHDSMASVFFGFADKEFVKPKPREITERLLNFEDLAQTDGALVKTNEGEFVVRFENELAPQTVKQFARLLRTGALNGAKATRLTREGSSLTITFAASLSPEQRKLLVRSFPKEKGAPHRDATFSMCPSNEKNGPVTFDLVIGTVPSRDERCTAFAMPVTVAGSPALRKMIEMTADENGTPSADIQITGGETFLSTTQNARSSM